MEPITFDPAQFDLNKAVEIGGIWLGPMLGPVAAALWTVVGPALVAIYQSLVLASAQAGMGQALGQALGTVLLLAMIALAVVVILAAVVAILILVLVVSFLLTVVRAMGDRQPAPA